MNNKGYIGVIVALLLVCAYLGFNLSKKQDVIEVQAEEVADLGVERRELELELQKMMFSYDTLQTENTVLMAEMAAQKSQIEDLLKKVKDKDWSVSKLKKETNTLREIMKGYVVTIDSLNQLNQALMAENSEMRDRVATVEGEKESLLTRQQNMEGIIATGQILQAVGINAQAINLRNSGKQVETSRASKTEMIKACFTVIENKIAKPGTKNIFLRIIGPDGKVLPSAEANASREFEGEGTQPYSVARSIDYNNKMMDVCVFYTVANEIKDGDYKVFIYEDSHKIGSYDLILK